MENLQKEDSLLLPGLNVREQLVYDWTTSGISQIVRNKAGGFDADAELAEALARMKGPGGT